jgi:hypothetical protein
MSGSPLKKALTILVSMANLIDSLTKSKLPESRLLGKFGAVSPG